MRLGITDSNHRFQCFPLFSSIIFGKTIHPQFHPKILLMGENPNGGWLRGIETEPFESVIGDTETFAHNVRVSTFLVKHEQNRTVL